MQKIDFIFDFETRSRVDLKTAGTVVYAKDPSTEPTLLTYCFGQTGVVKKWRRGEPIPYEVLDVAYFPFSYNLIAHNIFFDYLIWVHSFSRLIPGLKVPQIDSITDNMADSCHFRTGGSLEMSSQMSGVGVLKDKSGRAAMLKQCKPDSSGKFPELTTEEDANFVKYGMLDTRILRDVYYSIPRLPYKERFAFEWTFRRNIQGIRLDMDLINVLNHIVSSTLPKLDKEFQTCVNYKYVMKSPKLLEFFKPHYPWIKNLQADTIRDMLASKESVPPHVRRALEIKDLAGSSSIAKLTAAKNQAHEGRIFGILAYHFTQTKRWAGRGIQVQNFPRVDGTRPDKLDFEMDVDDLATTVAAKYNEGLKDPIGFVKNLLRRIFIPDEGKEFLCGDFSKVEPTVLYWLVGMGDIPKKWYEEMAAKIYNKHVSEIGKDSEERQVGKAACLGSGYGMGWKRFITQIAKQAGINLDELTAKKAIHAYREVNKPVTELWKSLEIAFRKAILGEPSQLCGGKIIIEPMKGKFKGIQIRLPSGSYLYYHKAHERFVQEADEITGAVYTRKVLSYIGDEDGVYGVKDVYGGLLTEHIVSAIARDIMVPAMFRLEQAGFDVLNTVHDEIWAQAEAGRGEEFRQVMCVRPSWCADMFIDADFKTGRRYLK